MKIRQADDYSIIVELSKNEFSGITGITVKNESSSEYTNGVYPRQLSGREIPLNKAIDAYYSLKVVHELKKRISDDLDTLKKRLDEVTWPIPEHKEIRDQK